LLALLGCRRASASSRCNRDELGGATVDRRTGVLLSCRRNAVGGRRGCAWRNEAAVSRPLLKFGKRRTCAGLTGCPPHHGALQQRAHQRRHGDRGRSHGPAQHARHICKRTAAAHGGHARRVSARRLGDGRGIRALRAGAAAYLAVTRVLVGSRLIVPRRRRAPSAPSASGVRPRTAPRS